MFLILAIAVAVLVAAGLLLAVVWRRVVPTNMVHIVQSGGKTTSYGTGQKGGNVYYAIPSFVPLFGVLVSKLPTSNFEIPLKGYEAYDKDRAEFVLDVIGFFVIADTNVAAQRASTFERLKEQLDLIMRGAARKIMASHDINEILGDRATFGKSLTAEVDEGLKEWGVRTIQSMELLDIRDHANSQIIHDIKAKKAAIINADSRKVVADQHRGAEEAELLATQAVDLRKQEVALAVGQRTAQVEAEVGISQEKAKQEVQVEAAVTKEREMGVVQVGTMRQAEITRDAAVVAAEQKQRVDTIAAAAAKQVTVTTAEARSDQQKLEATGARDAALLAAEGTKATGEATAEAKRLLEMSTVTPALELAKGTTGNADYQNYLVRIREVEKDERIGVAQAVALEDADVKIIANTGSAGEGMAQVRGVLNSSTGTGLGALLEGFANTPEGAAVLARFGMTSDGKATTTRK